jgi:hypothetical protein
MKYNLIFELPFRQFSRYHNLSLTMAAPQASMLGCTAHSLPLLEVRLVESKLLESVYSTVVVVLPQGRQSAYFALLQLLLVANGGDMARNAEYHQHRQANRQG